MGRHSKESKKSYRKKQKRMKKAPKQNITTRGNQVCNIFRPKTDERSSDQTSSCQENSFEVSGVQSLPDSGHNDSTGLEGQASENQRKSDTPVRLPIHADPLYIGLCEYSMLKRRLSNILERQHLATTE